LHLLFSDAYTFLLPLSPGSQKMERGIYKKITYLSKVKEQSEKLVDI
jgi:hypothetical protein